MSTYIRVNIYIHIAYIYMCEMTHEYELESIQLRHFQESMNL